MSFAMITVVLPGLLTLFARSPSVSNTFQNKRKVTETDSVNSDALGTRGSGWRTQKFFLLPHLLPTVFGCHSVTMCTYKHVSHPPACGEGQPAGCEAGLLISVCISPQPACPGGPRLFRLVLSVHHLLITVPPPVRKLPSLPHPHSNNLTVAVP